MKRTYFLKAKQALVAVMVAAAAMFTACGDDVDEPVPDPVKLSTPVFGEFVRGAGEATATLTVEWGFVDGATGYAVEVVKTAQVDETGMTETSESVYNQTTDRNKVDLTVAYGGEYKIKVAAVGDGKLYLDSDAAETVYFWYVAPTTVEAGDLATTLPALFGAADEEVTFALVAGRNYTLNAPIDFGGRRVTVKSMANVGTEAEPVIVENGAHAVVVLGTDGTFRTGNSLTLKNLSIDASAQVAADGTVTKPGYLEGRTSPGWGIIEGSFDAAALAAASQEADGLQNYLLNNITIDGCYVKNVPCNFTHAGDYAWAFNAINITNSIIQLNNNGHYGDATVFGTYGGGLQPDGGTNWRVGAVKDLKVENSTIYNIQKNSKNRMLRWNGNNRSHHFVGDVTVSITFNNVTLSQVMTAKEFANGTWNNKDWATITFTNNVYRDCFRVLNKMNVRGCTNVVTNNLGWCTGVDESGDPEGSKGDDESTIEELGGDAAVKWTAFNFGGDVNAQLDLTKENAGVNFKASAAAAGQGDSRWN